MEKQRYTLAVLVDNESGVLSQVSRLFSRKGYNIQSLAVGTTERPEVSRITIEILAEDDAHVELLCNQLRKLFPVHSVKLLQNDRALRRELVLIKVCAETADARNEIIQVSNIFRASIIDVAPGSLTLAVIGEEEKTEAIKNLVEKHGILELVRTGVVALERGAFTLNEETKEKGEFNYGKNVR
jgi:acetolactate synthase-1/3 small subunit